MLIAAAIFTVYAVISSMKAHRPTPTTGVEGLRGEIGRAESEINPEGMVFVRGERWNAESAERIAPGEKIVVEDVHGLVLTVRRVQPK